MYIYICIYIYMHTYICMFSLTCTACIFINVLCKCLGYKHSSIPFAMCGY